MSIWSRSHADLAQLAKDLQDRNNRVKTKTAQTGKGVLHRQTSVPTLDTFRRKSLSAQDQGKKLAQKLKSVRFCLSDGASPDQSFEDEHKSNTSSQSSELELSQSRESVFSDSCIEKLSSEKDNENNKIKHLSEAPNGLFSKLDMSDKSQNTNGNQHDIKETSVDNKTETFNKSHEELLKDQITNQPLEEQGEILAPQHKAELHPESCEDGSPGQARLENGVSRHVLYLLQKDFISSSAGNANTRLTLQELEGILDKLLTSQAKNGDERHKNMIKMVQTLISRQKSKIRKDVENLESSGLAEMDKTSNCNLSLKFCPNESVLIEKRDRSHSSEKLNCKEDGDFLMVAEHARTNDDDDDDDDDGGGVDVHLKLKQEHSEERHFEINGKLALNGTTSESITNDSAIQIDHVGSRSTMLHSFGSNNSCGEFSDEEIKEIMARGKNLILMEAEKRGSLSSNVSSRNGRDDDGNDSKVNLLIRGSPDRSPQACRNSLDSRFSNESEDFLQEDIKQERESLDLFKDNTTSSTSQTDVFFEAVDEQKEKDTKTGDISSSNSCSTSIPDPEEKDSKPDAINHSDGSGNRRDLESSKASFDAKHLHRGLESPNCGKLKPSDSLFLDVSQSWSSSLVSSQKNSSSDLSSSQFRNVSLHSSLEETSKERSTTGVASLSLEKLPRTGLQTSAAKTQGDVPLDAVFMGSSKHDAGNFLSADKSEKKGKFVGSPSPDIDHPSPIFRCYKHDDKMETTIRYREDGSQTCCVQPCNVRSRKSRCLCTDCVSLETSDQPSYSSSSEKPNYRSERSRERSQRHTDQQTYDKAKSNRYFEEEDDKHSSHFKENRNKRQKFRPTLERNDRQTLQELFSSEEHVNFRGRFHKYSDTMPESVSEEENFRIHWRAKADHGSGDPTYYDNDESERQNPYGKKHRLSPPSPNLSGSPGSSVSCHCSKKQRVTHGDAKLLRMQRSSGVPERLYRDKGRLEAESTWSGSCQCSRCLAFRSSLSSVSSVENISTKQTHPMLKSNKYSRGSDYSDITRLRKHSLPKTGYRLDRSVKPYNHNKHFREGPQLAAYTSDTSETFESLRSDVLNRRKKGNPKKADKVDAATLKDILEDFHELFVCLCRERDQGTLSAEVKRSSEDLIVRTEDGTRTEDEMESVERTYLTLDSEFDQVLADMKPHVLKLPHKSERQRCAVWIKRLCEPPSAGVTGRKNRNMYSQLMLQMLKRGVLEGPFEKKPAEGPLPTLPPYMSIYFDEPMTGRDGQREETDKVPDWVNGELLESVGSSVMRKSTLGNPAATSTWLSGSSGAGADIRERPYSSLGVSLDRDPGLSPPRKSYGDGGSRGAAVGSLLNDMDWSKPYTSSTFASSLPKGTTFQEDTSIGRGGEREVELRTKMVEAKYHEEKLRLQQKHDAAVQKILDRKNAEIEDVKGHYRGKAKELEDANTKLERKIQSLLKEMSLSRDSKDKQIADLKKLVEDTSDSRKSEYDKKLHEITADFDQEKFEMQKQHTRNIQEILDDTNARLQRMEKEYTQQMASNTNIIRELETRVQQLTTETEQQLKLRSSVEREKVELADKCDLITSELGELKDRYSELAREHEQEQHSHEHEMRTIKHKTEASLEFLKQEHTLAAGKASEAVKEMENQVENMRRTMRDKDDHHQRQIRELEQVQQQDKLHLENLHDKQIRSMKKELEQVEEESQKKIRHLEHLLQEKEIEIGRWKEQNREQGVSAERALEEFKSEVEKNQTRMYEEMKQQMTQVESDLNKSKQTREKQNRELNRQLDQERSKFERQITEMKVSFEHERSQMLHDLHLQKEYILSEHEKAVETLKEGHRVELRSLEARYRDRQDKDSKNVVESESQVRELREELVQSNQLRKQQLVELGLLREEEKQKMQRDHQQELSRLRSEMEQQRLELQKSHSGEMEAMLEKTNQRLKDIEREYAEKGQKSTEVVAEFQASTNQLRDEIKRIREESDHRIAELVTQQEVDRKAMKKQYSTNLTALQKELDSQRSRSRHLERQQQRGEADQEEKMTRLKLSYEEKMRGLMPAVVRQELEDTIVSLKSQVNSLQQRAAVLQDELDLKMKNPLSSFGAMTSSPIIKSSV